MSTHQKRIKFEIQARSSEVTGSCLLCSVTFPDEEKFKFIVDAGSFQGSESVFLNRIADFKVSEIDHIFLTHNHVDHIGAVPAFVKRGFSGKFHTTKGTRSLLPVSLFDSAKIEKKDASITGLSPIYTTEEVVSALQLVEGYNYNEIIRINPNISATFFENGHMYGSAIILFEFSFEEETLNVLFTGDYNNKNYFFTPKRLPAWVQNLENLIIVQESTYGASYSEDVEKHFEEDISKIISSGKSILLPCIAQERYEIILSHLKDLQDCGKLPLDIPIFIDGPLAFNYLHKYTKIYGDSFLPKQMREVSVPDRGLIVKSREQKIIVTTSGMCTNGPAELYLQQIISNPNWVIYFNCYQSEGTIGRQLLDFQKERNESSIKLWGIEYTPRIQVYSTNEFSSHAKCDELIEFLLMFKHISSVIVNHGEASVKEAYASKLKELEICKNIYILSREKYFIFDKLGLVSEQNTKFVMEEDTKYSKQISSYKKKKKDSTKMRAPNVRIRVFAHPKLSYQIYGNF